MLLIPHPIEFTSASDVQVHLDTWAARSLADEQSWSDALAVTRDWADYSARNQLLLASYGAVGPVAGVETWRLTPARDGGTCAVRSGEHALPVRVPITTAGSEPDPHLGGRRATTSAVQGWEWRGVFCLEQLARRPNQATLAAPAAWDRLDPDTLLKATVSIARKATGKQLRQVDDPASVLLLAASNLQRADERPRLDPDRAGQVAGLVMARIGAMSSPLPGFDPVGLPSRERWESLLDVLDTQHRLTRHLGAQLGVDLMASPLPRMAIDDAGVVPARRRNRLPRASLAELPVGDWVEVGPYTPDEWRNRGEDAAGRGAYLRLNSTAYLVALESTDGATWRLEDTRARTGAGRLDGGDEVSLDGAKATAITTLHHRYPQLARHLPDRTHVDAPVALTKWREVDSPPGASCLQHASGVSSFVLRAGTMWVPMLQRSPDSLLEAVGTPTSDRSEAMRTAEHSALLIARTVAIDTPRSLDEALTALAAGPDYDRAALVELVSPQLDDPQRVVLEQGPSAEDLVDLLGAAGASPLTTAAVLHIEQVDAAAAGPLLGMAGIAPAEAMHVMCDKWGATLLEAAEHVGASADEMREAGCTPAEILASRPLDALKSLPDDPHEWHLAGGTLATTGQSVDEVTGIMASRAPSPECFAAGVAAAVNDPAHALALSAKRGMPAEALAALTERYDLSREEAGRALVTAGVADKLAVQTVHWRCGADPVLTGQIAQSTLGLSAAEIAVSLDDRSAVSLATVHDLRPAPPAPSIPQPAPPAVTRPTSAALIGREALLASLPQPIPHPGHLERDIPHFPA